MQDRLYELQDILNDLYNERDYMLTYPKMFDEIDLALIETEIEKTLNEMQEIEYAIELLLDGNID